MAKARKGSKGADLDAAALLAEEAAVAGSGTAPKEGVKAFSGLAVAAACLIKAKKAMGTVEVPEAGPKIAKAWAELIDGSNLGLTALMQGQSYKAFFASEVAGAPGEAKRVAQWAPGFSEESILVVASGIHELAGQIDAFADGPQLREAGSSYAPMLGHPGGPRDFIYPMMALSVKASMTAHEGAKVASVTGSYLSGSADVLADPKKPWLDGWIASAGTASGLGKDVAAAEGARLGNLVAELADQAGPLLGEVDEAIAKGHRQVAVLSSAGSRAALIGESPLPSAAAMRSDLQAWAGSEFVGLSVGQIQPASATKQKYVADPKGLEMARRSAAAVDFAREAAIAAVSMALAPPEAAKSAGAMELQTRFGLFSGPLAQSKSAW